MTTTAAPVRTTPFRLGAKPRKAWLLVHIAAAGSWLGIDLVLAVLVVIALGGDPAVAESVYRVLEHFAVGPLVVVSLVTMASGIVLGQGTKYGLVRYWWVAVKLGMNVILSALVVFSLSGTLHEAAASAREYAADGVPDVSALLAPPIVSTAAVLVATALSVFKPWGRTRRAR